MTLVLFSSSGFAWEHFEYERDPLGPYDDYGSYRVCEACLDTEYGGEPIFGILYTLLTDNNQQIESVPDYLVHAIQQNRGLGVNHKVRYPVLRYIEYPELKKLICTVHFDAVDLYGAAQEPEFVRMITGFKLDENGVLEYNRDRKQTERTMYQDDLDIEYLDLERIILMFMEGLYNPDPRVRLTCLDFLIHIGPHPYYRPAVKYAIDQESIGNIHGGFAFDPKILSQWRHKYMKIRGCETEAIPYKEFTLFEKQISRIELIYHMEVVKDLTRQDFRLMSATLFTPLTDDILYLPQFSAVFDDDENPSDPQIPTERYLQRISLFDELSHNVLLDFNEETVPETFIYYPQGWAEEASFQEQITDSNIVINVDSVFTEEDRELGGPEDGTMAEEDLVYIVQLFCGAMYSNDFSIQAKAAQFLKQAYNTFHFDRVTRNMIIEAFDQNPYFYLDSDDEIRTYDIEISVD